MILEFLVIFHQNRFFARISEYLSKDFEKSKECTEVNNNCAKFFDCYRGFRQSDTCGDVSVDVTVKLLVLDRVSSEIFLDFLLPRPQKIEEIPKKAEIREKSPNFEEPGDIYVEFTVPLLKLTQKAQEKSDLNRPSRSRRKKKMHKKK